MILPKRIAGRPAGATSTPCKNPSRRSSMMETVEKMAVKRTIRRMIPGKKYVCLLYTSDAAGSQQKPEKNRRGQGSDHPVFLPEKTDDFAQGETEGGLHHKSEFPGGGGPVAPGFLQEEILQGGTTKGDGGDLLLSLIHI